MSFPPLSDIMRVYKEVDQAAKDVLIVYDKIEGYEKKYAKPIKIGLIIGAVVIGVMLFLLLIIMFAVFAKCGCKCDERAEYSLMRRFD